MAGNGDLSEVRRDLHELVHLPLKRYRTTLPGHAKTREYQRLLSVPLDLAAAGFDVTVSRGERGWMLCIERSVDAGVVSLHGEAQSYLVALFQIGDQAEATLQDLETAYRKRAAKAQEVAA